MIFFKKNNGLLISLNEMLKDLFCVASGWQDDSRLHHRSVPAGSGVQCTQHRPRGVPEHAQLQHEGNFTILHLNHCVV